MSYQEKNKGVSQLDIVEGKLNKAYLSHSFFYSNIGKKMKKYFIRYLYYFYQDALQLQTNKGSGLTFDTHP